MSVVTILDARDAPSPPGKAQRIAQRVNRRGEVWCNNCKCYLPTDQFRRHPGRPHTWWAYCKPCTRVIDRMRYHAKMRDPLAKRIEMNRRVRQKQASQRAVFAGRRAELASGIDLLRRRGLTYTDIGAICELSRASLSQWASGSVRKPTMSVVERIGALVVLTIDWPLADAPACNRRLAHPERARLAAAMRPVCEAWPVRNRWHASEEDAS